MKPAAPPARGWHGLPERLLSALLVAVAVFVVVLEVTVWRWLTGLGRLLARVAFFANLERLIDRLSPGAVVAVFVVPFIPIVPLLKVAEFWLIRNRHFFWAVVVIAGAKVAGAAFSTRVFAVARPKMLQVPWFARFYAWMTRMLGLGHRALAAVPGWSATRALAHRVHLAGRRATAALGRWLRHRLSAEPPGLLGQRLAAAVRRVRGDGSL